jgi:hypothetical protein
MKFPAKVSLGLGYTNWTICCLLTFATAEAWAQGFRLESAGARFAFGAEGSDSDFRQAEAFVDWNLPWQWDLGKDWHLQTRLGLSAGALWEIGDSGKDGFVGTAGPILALGNSRFPLSLIGGVSPTVLSRYNFHEKNFGEPVQFTSHIGLAFDIASRVRISYRFQHMSNAGLSSDNPGLNLHMFGLSYIF